MLLSKPNLIIYLYSIELLARFGYVFMSLSFCVLVSLFNIHSLILFETYPFIKLSSQKFIITHITDLLDVTWILVTYVSFLYVLPLFSYQLIQFFKSSWYNYQINLAIKLFYWINSMFILNLNLCYFIVIPTILNFLTNWEKLKQTNSILMIEDEFRILNYVDWILMFQCCFIFFIFLYLVLILRIWFFYRIEKIYYVMRLYRKQLIFFNIIGLFLLCPSDVFLQFFAIFFVILFYEMVFFFICYKIFNSN